MSEEKKKFNISEDKPTDWFEDLYSGTNESGAGVPWANMEPHPMFAKWFDDVPAPKPGTTALVVGCGLGDDALALEDKGYKVTAFDVSESAIDLCKKRFPDSNTAFVTADLLAGIPEWNNSFDLVLEIFTIQALPPKYEAKAIKNITDLVSPGGELVVVTAMVSTPRSFEQGPPWILNSDYVEKVESFGLKLMQQVRNTKSEMGEELHLSVFTKAAR